LPKRGGIYIISSRPKVSRPVKVLLFETGCKLRYSSRESGALHVVVNLDSSIDELGSNNVVKIEILWIGRLVTWTKGNGTIHLGTVHISNSHLDDFDAKVINQTLSSCCGPVVWVIFWSITDAIAREKTRD